MGEQGVTGSFFIKSAVSMILIVIGIVGGLFLGDIFGVTGLVANRTVDPAEIDHGTNLMLGKAFPDTPVIDTQGNKVALAELLAGGKTVLCFVTSGCGACSQFINIITENPILPDDSYQLILITPDPDYTQSQSAWPIYRIAWEKLEQERIFSFPTIVGIDNSQHIAFVLPGYTPRLDRDYLEKFLQ